MPPAGNSQSWTSPVATQAAKLQRLQNNASHLGFGHSPFFPRNLQEYMRYQMEHAGDLAVREREKLGVRMGEIEARKRMEFEKAEDRECVERILRGMGGSEEVGVIAEHDGEGEKDGDEEDVAPSHEEQLQEARAGEVKASKGGFKATGTEIEAEGAESEEQIEGTEVESSESAEKATATKEKILKKHRSQGSKGKSRNDIQEVNPIAEESKPTKSNLAIGHKTKSTDELAKTLAASALSDPLLRGVLAKTAKLPTSSLWKVFTQSPLYQPAGSGAEISALMQQGTKPGYTPVLGAKTNVWSGDEQLKPEGKRDPKTGEHRSSWPDLSEMKAQGQYRKEASNERRFPLPRKDMMNREAVLAQAGDYSKLSEEELEERIRELEKKTGEDIPWCEREIIRYKDFDRLESVSNERREDGKRRRVGAPTLGPYGANAGLGTAQVGGPLGTSPDGIWPGYQYGRTYGSGYQSRGGLNMGAGVRGGYSNTARGRGYPVPAQPKFINHEAISYGAGGLGDGKKPPPGGWQFDEVLLKQKGEWKDLLENHL